MKITVLGAGISGLATAYILKRSGHDVSILAKEFSPNITSNKAAAFWFPYHIRNDKRGIEWCRKSYVTYNSFITDIASGVSLKRIIKGVKNNVAEDNSWIEYMPEDSCRLVPNSNLPFGYNKAYEAEVPLIETQIFLPWLMEQIEKIGVKIKQQSIKSFEEVTDADYIINCCGLGSKDLTDDNELFAVRGQVALLAPKEISYIFLDNDKPLYIVPRKDAIIVGGTYEENVYEEKTQEETLKILIKNVIEINPELASQPLIGSWAGLRPFRKNVRLEKEGNIIHNYGHGGSGYTLAWGCAESVNEIINLSNTEK